MKKESKDDMYFSLTFLLLFGIFIGGVFNIYAGIKNVDYSRNVLWMSCQFEDIDYYKIRDTGSNGVRNFTYGMDDWYLIGFKQIYRGFLMLVIDIIVLFFIMINSKLNEKSFKIFNPQK